MTPETMRGAWIGRYGGPEVVEVRDDLPVPAPGPGQLLVRVEAAGVAFADTLMRRGIYPDVPTPPFVPGYDLVGEVVGLGPDVTGFDVGQRVAALTTRGACAEYAVAAAARSVVVPDEATAPAATAASAVALVLNYVTAHQMLHRVAKVTRGDRILVWGAAGGVGTALLELAAASGVAAIGVASGARTDLVTARGATPVDRSLGGAGDAEAAIRALAPDGVDATFDAIGGPHLAVSARLTKRSGRVVSYGTGFAPSDAGQTGVLLRHGLALAAAKLRPGASASLYIITGRGGWLEKHPDDFPADLAALVDRLVDGSITPLVDTMPLAEVSAAHRRLEAGTVEGKLVLVP